MPRLSNHLTTNLVITPFIITKLFFWRDISYKIIKLYIIRICANIPKADTVSVKLKHLSIFNIHFHKKWQKKINHFHKVYYNCFLLVTQGTLRPNIKYILVIFNFIISLIIPPYHVARDVRAWLGSKSFLATKVRTRVHTKLSTIVSIVANPCVDCTWIPTVTFQSIDCSNRGSKSLVQNRPYAIHPKPQTRPESYSWIATHKFGLA